MKNEEENSVDMILYGTIGSDEWWDDICDKTYILTHLVEVYLQQWR